MKRHELIFRAFILISLCVYVLAPPSFASYIFKDALRVPLSNAKFRAKNAIFEIKNLPHSLSIDEMNSIVGMAHQNTLLHKLSIKTIIELGDADFSYIVTIDEEIAGILVSVLEDNNHLIIQLIATNSQYRKIGIGTSMLYMLAKKAQEENIRVIKVTVPSKNNDLVLFLEKLGFSRIGRVSRNIVNLGTKPVSLIETIEAKMQDQKIELFEVAVHRSKGCSL